jgi:hypothetical protein
MQSRTTKVVMIVDNVSPTPFALLRRAKHFEYRDDDAALQKFSEYEDTIKALTDECRRVLECIANANQSVVAASAADPKTPDPSWSRFEDFGFSGIMDTPTTANGTSTGGTSNDFSSIGSGPRSNNTDFGRPTTPSWADFLSSGFADENNQSPPTTRARINTTPPGGPPTGYNSSASAVCAIWFMFQIYCVNYLRASRPQFQFPAIIYSIFAIVSMSYGPTFPTMTYCISFMQRLIEAFLTGFGLSTAVHFFIFPLSSRMVVFKEMTGYLMYV